MKTMPSKKQGRPGKPKDMVGHDLPKVPADAMAPDEGPAEHEKEGWLRTLMDAEDIKADPKKMEHVQKHAGDKVGKIKSIQDIKDYTSAKYGKTKAC